MWFDDYGELDPISRDEYLHGPYRYVGFATAEDDIEYDIVRNTETDQEYYTEV